VHVCLRLLLYGKARPFELGTCIADERSACVGYDIVASANLPSLACPARGARNVRNHGDDA
jgi:hypothetical protein